jgi:hypothetical protein
MEKTWAIVQDSSSPIRKLRDAATIVANTKSTARSTELIESFTRKGEEPLEDVLYESTDIETRQIGA